MVFATNQTALNPQNYYASPSKIALARHHHQVTLFATVVRTLFPQPGLLELAVKSHTATFNSRTYNSTLYQHFDEPTTCADSQRP